MVLKFYNIGWPSNFASICLVTHCRLVLNLRVRLLRQTEMGSKVILDYLGLNLNTCFVLTPFVVSDSKLEICYLARIYLYLQCFCFAQSVMDFFVLWVLFYDNLFQALKCPVNGICVCFKLVLSDAHMPVALSTLSSQA